MEEAEAEAEAMRGRLKVPGRRGLLARRPG